MTLAHPSTAHTTGQTKEYFVRTFWTRGFGISHTASRSTAKAVVLIVAVAVVVL